MKRRSTSWFNTASTSLPQAAMIAQALHLGACDAASTLPPRTTVSGATSGAGQITGPQPRTPNPSSCTRTRSGAQPTGCVPEFDYDQHQAILTIRLKILSAAPSICQQNGESGNSGWLPPVEAKCSWAPDRRCHQAPEGDEASFPWDYLPSSLEGVRHWKGALGDTYSSDIGMAGNFHMRFSWKRGGGLCLVVFEAWGDTDNDGRYYAEVAGDLFDDTGSLIRSTKALATQRGSLEETRSPGAAVPLTLDIFANDRGDGTLLDKYISGQQDGDNYSDPLEDYSDWMKRHAPI